MSYNVETVRQSITIITKILSGKGLKVTQSGENAFVESVAGIPKRINIPYIPDNASDELMLAINGFLDHEVAHVLFTDFSISQKHHFKNKTVFQIYNIIEDCRIEACMKAKFAGSRSNLDGVSQFLIDRYITEEFKKAKASGDEKAIIGSLFMPAMRAWSGQDIFQRYMADKRADIKPLTDKIKIHLPLISRVDSTQASIELAHEIFKSLEGKSKEESKDKSPKTDKKKEGEKSKSEEPGSDEEFKKAKASGDEKASSSSDDEDKSDESEEEEISINLSDAINEGEFDSSKSISEMIAREISATTSDRDYRIFSTDFDKVENFEATKYQDQDQINRALVNIEKETREVAGTLQKTLERLVKAKANVRNLPGKRSGRVNPSSLFRLKTGDDRVFRQRDAGTNNEVAVSLVVDCSGSMSGSKMCLAMEGAFALCDTLTRLGITNEVIGFTTSNDQSIITGIEAQGEDRNHYSRHEPLYIPIFKGFNEQFGTEQKMRIASASKGGGFMRNNIDGESLRIAAKRLMTMTSERAKQIIVLSDGTPAGYGNYGKIDRDLSDATKDVEKMGIKLIGIGIDDHSVKCYYKNNLVISNISELPTAIVKELKALLV